MIRTILVVTVALLLILIPAPIVILYSFFARNTDPLYAFGILSIRIVLWVAGVEREVYGQEKIPHGRPVVFMANHQGNCDPPAILAHVPPVRVLVKKEFFRIPILGLGMRMRGFIPVDRRNRERAIRAVEQAVAALRAGHSFLVFPEGTRSPDGRLQPFKKGVFVMAIKAGVPIVPISISGSSRIMRKGEVAIHPGKVRIIFHDPIPTEGCGIEDREIVRQKVWQAVLAGLEESEKPLGSGAVRARAPAGPRVRT
jgi:1-acyl-sn-glycerol-3-phosphate acyltransferase